MERARDGRVMPTRTSCSFDRYKIKVQDVEQVAQFCKMHERCPSKGWRAAMLIHKKGHIGKRVAMAAAPLILNCSIPKGKAILARLPTISYKMNVIVMDENADVTFGNKDYPGTVCM